MPRAFSSTGLSAPFLPHVFSPRYVRPKKIVAEMEEQLDRPIPSVRRIVGDYLFNFAIFEVVFYGLHHLLHQGAFYKQIHKIHHQVRGERSIGSIGSIGSRTRLQVTMVETDVEKRMLVHVHGLGGCKRSLV